MIIFLIMYELFLVLNPQSIAPVPRHSDSLGNRDISRQYFLFTIVTCVIEN